MTVGYLVQPYTSIVATVDLEDCGEIVSVQHGSVKTIVEIAVKKVRSEQCIMQIPFNYIPKSGTRTGARVLIECPNDGKGCLKVDPEFSTFEIVVDIPKYSRTVEYSSNLQRYDDDPTTVPFYSTNIQMNQNESMPLCYNHMDSTGYLLRPMEGAIPSTSFYRHRTFAIGLAPHNSPFNISGLIPEYDINIIPSDVTPRIAPGLLSGAGFTMYVSSFNVTSYYPPQGDFLVKVNQSIVFPLVNTQEGSLYMGITADTYIGEGESLFYTSPVVNMAQFDVVGDLGLPVFQKSVTYGSGSQCLSEEDWNMVLGDNETASTGTWKWHHCGGSANCTGSAWGCGYWDNQIRRDIKVPLISETPNCRHFHFGEKLLETAEISASVDIVSGLSTVITSSGFDGVELISNPSTIPRTDVLGNAFVSTVLITDRTSVPNLIIDPVENLEGFNCFSFRDSVANASIGEIDTDNPYRENPINTTNSECGNCTPSIMPNQRGLIFIDTQKFGLFMRSECGGMNYGPGYWLHLGRVHKQFVFKSDIRQIIAKENGGDLEGFLEETIAGSMANRGTTGCLSGYTCLTSSPCTLIRDELTWLRSRSVIPTGIVENPGMDVELTNCTFRVGSPEFETDGVYNFTHLKIMNMTEDNPNRRFTFVEAGPYFGCDTFQQVPYSLSNPFWNVPRPNIWLASNRALPDSVNKLYLEDTFLNPFNRISEGVSFLVKIEIPSGIFNFIETNITGIGGCLNMPIVNQVTQTLDFCNDINATLTGTANVRATSNTTTFPKEIVLTVACTPARAGGFCLDFDPVHSFVMIKDSSITVTTTITVESEIPPEEIPILYPDLDSTGNFPPVISEPGLNISRMIFR